LNLTTDRTYLDNFLNKPGPTSDPEWVPGEDTIDNLETSKILSVSILIRDEKEIDQYVIG